MEFLKFDVQERIGDRKTDIVRVLSKDKPDVVLGTIRWYGAWRMYTFFPTVATLFSQGCLEQINGEIRRLMDDRKKAV